MDSADQYPLAIGGHNRVVAANEATIAPILGLVISDLLAVAATLSLLRLCFGAATLELPVLLAGLVCFGLGVSVFGLYPGRGKFGPDRIRIRALVALIAFLPPTVAGAIWASSAPTVLLQCLVAGLVLFFVSSFFEVIAIAVLHSRKLWQTDAWILGDPEDTRRIRRDLELFPELGLRPVSDEADLALREPVRLQAAGIVGSDDEFLFDSASPLPSLHRIARHHAAPVNGNHTAQRLVKRTLDFVGAIILLIIVSPILAVTALMILIYDGRPVLFLQPRGGKDGGDLRICKFRSMYKDAPARLESVLASDPERRSEWSRFFKLRNDPRILPVIGNFIRSTSIDELPQLWNVLKGDMSLVGPRPFPYNHLAALPLKFQAIRAEVMPGITGLWQITLRSDGDLQMQELLDTAYVRGWSIWLDFYILFRTPVALASSRGAR